MIDFPTESSDHVNACSLDQLVLAVHTLELNKCNDIFLLPLVVDIKIRNFLNQLDPIPIYLALVLIPLVILLWVCCLLVMKDLLLLVEFLELEKHVHASEVIQCKVYVHDLVLILIDLILFPRFQHCRPMLFQMRLNPSPHSRFELKMVDSTIFRQISNFHSEISGRDLELIQVLADYILVPLLKRDQ